MEHRPIPPVFKTIANKKRSRKASFLQQFKVAFVAVDDTFGAELADLHRKAAAIHLQVVGKLLTVKGDGKVTAVVLAGHLRKVRKQFLARGTLGEDLCLFVHLQIFFGEDLH